VQTTRRQQHPACLAAWLQVLLLFNLDVLNGLANGTRGVVEDFVPFREYLKQVSKLLVAHLCAAAPIFRNRGYQQHGIWSRGPNWPASKWAYVFRHADIVWAICHWCVCVQERVSCADNVQATSGKLEPKQQLQQLPQPPPQPQQLPRFREASEPDSNVSCGSHASDGRDCPPTPPPPPPRPATYTTTGQATPSWSS
jgi:hypothetical protein